MKTWNWSGYKWYKQEPWGKIHPDKAWNYYDEKAIAFGQAHGLKLVKGDLSNVNENDFDLVIMSHSLEHIPNPTEIINDISSKMGDAGKLFINVPSFIPKVLSKELINEIVLSNQKILPKKLLKNEYNFFASTIEEAIENL